MLPLRVVLSLERLLVKGQGKLRSFFCCLSLPPLMSIMSSIFAVESSCVLDFSLLIINPYINLILMPQYSTLPRSERLRKVVDFATYRPYRYLNNVGLYSYSEFTFVERQACAT